MELQDPNLMGSEAPGTPVVDKGTVSIKFSLRMLKSGMVLYSVLTASIMSLLIGATLSFPSFALLEFMNYSDPAFRFNTAMVDLFGAIASVGSAIGGPLALWMANSWGRKTSLMFNPVFYAIGYFIILSTYLSTNGTVFKTFLIIGRFITGIGAGWSVVAVGIYIEEVAPHEFRNILEIVSDTALSLGSLLLYALSSIPIMKYYYLALVLIAVSFIYMLLAVWIPETPLWLLWKYGDKEGVIDLLNLLYGSGKTSKMGNEFARLEASLADYNLGLFKKLKLMFCTSFIQIPLLLLLFLSAFQQLCGGQSVVPTYAGLIFESANAPNPNEASAYSVGLSLVVATVLTGLLMGKVGIKVLLSISAAGMMISSAVIGTLNYVIRPFFRCPFYNITIEDYVYDSSCKFLFPLTAVSIAVFTLSYAIGVGPIPGLLFTEYMPVSVRGYTRAVSKSVNGIAGMLIIAIFPSYVAIPENYLAWWSLAVINLFGLIFVVLFVKETKDKTYKEIQESFCFGTGCACVMCKNFNYKKTSE